MRSNVRYLSRCSHVASGGTCLEADMRLWDFPALAPAIQETVQLEPFGFAPASVILDPSRQSETRTLLRLVGSSRERRYGLLFEMFRSPRKAVTSRSERSDNADEVASALADVLRQRSWR